MPPGPYLACSVLYRWFGLAILRKSWINFDLIWAVALLVVGATALWTALGAGGHAA